MNDLNFEQSEHRWDFDRFAMAFDAYDGEKRVMCMISGEALLGHFGAKPLREAMEVAFVVNKPEIEEKARELYRAGTLNEEGRLLLRSSDFQYQNGAVALAKR